MNALSRTAKAVLAPIVGVIYTRFKGDPMPEFAKGPFYSDEVYEQIQRGFIIACADVAVFDESGRMVLATRCIKPMNDGPWVYGGRRMPGEAAIDAAIRHFRDDTGLDLPPERLTLLAQTEYVWPDRQQKPQDVPTHNMVHTFSVVLTDLEIDRMTRQLSTKEYVPGSLRRYTADELQQPNVHQVLRDLYNLHQAQLSIAL